MIKIILIFLFFNVVSYGQELLHLNDYNNNLDDAKPGEKVYIKRKTGEKMKDGDYTFQLSEGGQFLTFWFSIENKEIHGNVNAVIGLKKEGNLLAKLTVNQGIVMGLKKYHEKENSLEKEILKKGDTIITKRYHRDAKLYFERVMLGAERLYEYSCTVYYDEPLRIDKCSKIDVVKGIEEHYYKEKLIKRIKTKNIPNTIEIIEENFDLKSNTKKVIIYKEGKIKTIYKDGGYKIKKPIEGGVYEEIYDSKGKLIDSGKVYNIMGG